MKDLIKLFILFASLYSNLLLAKNFEIPEEGIAIKNITCETPTSSKNNTDRYKLITMLNYNTNDNPVESKILNFDL
jgi:hypothetical protein